MVTKRKNTRLESEGAEFIVVGWLLINGIEAHKTYTSMPGYDLVALNAGRNKSARIQVKSRYSTGVSHSIIKNFDSDFVVFVKLNRGYPKPRKNGSKGIQAPEFYVVPTQVVFEAQDPDDSWHKIKFKSIPDFDIYRDNWQLIRNYLDT
ncbi:MAG: hypothetical protein HOD37_08780 [Bacteroidetes bacterium]|jgi:hypothetical protein|nr:hypothetical protein [Bacteroidota bacterium]